MGSYSTLRLGSLAIGSDKNGINPLVMTLFREVDKRVRSVTVVDADAAKYVNLEEWEPPERFDIIQYSASAQVIRDRLELMGFTLQAALLAFNAAIEAERDRHASLAERLDVTLPGRTVDVTRLALQELTADSWLHGLRSIVQSGLRPTYAADPGLESLPIVLRYMLGHTLGAWYGFPGNDVRVVLRLAIEALPEADLVYDLTDLILGGYFDSTDEVTAEADFLLSDDFVVTRRVVVLTEGAVDKWILERSLRILLPHVADYFAFMDFEGARVAGGAGALASMVRAFVGAGIVNRIIAVFDNDTAGSSAIQSLTGIDLPSNIAVVRLPEIALAVDYPTIGPTGAAKMDVNGLAGSIELYLGADVLSLDGDFLPVHWRGYDQSIGKYQGEVAKKRLIHERFRAKVRECELHPERTEEHMWSEMRLVLQRLCCAFNDTDASAIIAAERK